MVSVFQAILLSIIQGITEWLPVSSSGHLALMQNIFGFQNLEFDVFLHIASMLAVILIFWKDIINILDLRKRENLIYILLIILALVPASIAGLFFKEAIEKSFSNLAYLGIFFIISGILVYSTKFAKEIKENITWFDSLFIGVFQAVAVLPGISRSGATISSGLFRGLEKESAVKFSFLLAIPLILGAGLVESKNLILSDINYLILISSFIVTFLVSVIAIRLLLRIIKSEKFYLFGIYNLLLGVLLLIVSFLK